MLSEKKVAYSVGLCYNIRLQKYVMLYHSYKKYTEWEGLTALGQDGLYDVGKS